VFVDDFRDADPALDPWLAGEGRQGLAWVAPAGQEPWHIQPAGDRPCLSAMGTTGPTWMLTVQGEDWADYTVTYEYSNAYNQGGAGVLLRANEATEGYLVAILGGRIARRSRKDGGEIVETVLATGQVAVPRAGRGKCHFSIETTGRGVRICGDQQGDGVPELEAVDASPEAIPAGRLGVYSRSANQWHRTDLVGIRVQLEPTGAE
jgi:hypothetical protein